MAMAILLPFPNLFAQTPATNVIRYADVRNPVYDARGMVVSANVLASEIGARVLADGGTAVDAAVAVGFALSVVLPRAGNIGGGGFMLIYSNADDKTEAIDYRETAPLAATRDMFLDSDGNIDIQRARFSHLSVGVPGTIAGLHLAHEKYGKLPWRRLLEPAINMAKQGIKENQFAQCFLARVEGLLQLAVTRENFSFLDEVHRVIEQFSGIFAIDHRKLSVELVVDLRHVMLEGKRFGSNFDRSFLLFLPFLGQGIVSGTNDLLGAVYEIAHGHLFLLTFHALALHGFP